MTLETNTQFKHMHPPCMCFNKKCCQCGVATLLSFTRSEVFPFISQGYTILCYVHVPGNKCDTCTYLMLVHIWLD